MQIPIYAGLTDDELSRIATEVRAVLVKAASVPGAASASRS